MLMDYGNSLNALNDVLGTSYTREGLTDYFLTYMLDTGGDGERIIKDMDYWVMKGQAGYTSQGKPILAAYDPYKWANDTYFMNKSDEELLDFERNRYSKGVYNYHMAGLDRVPKDNYHALLHKDEMVLNKSDAERYRQLLGGKGYGYGGSLNPNAADYVGSHHSGYAGHNGIDLYFDKIGTPVGSAVAGTVSESKDIPANYNDGKSYHGKDTNGNAYSSYGRVVKVKGDDGHTYVYAHLNERAVSAGDKVNAGTLLGYSGTTGNSSGPHLHFEVVGAGTGEAAHAKYYTPYVRSADGASARSGSVSSDDSSSDSSSYSINALAKVNRTGTRAIVGLGGIGGPGNVPNSTDRIVESVDGVSEKIINYLNEIRQEQADQRRLINAFASSQSNIQDYR
ncbi:MAG: M23 family metallopeptidase [Bacilli bacterium]|nr:M23 family metallopeptidase [Bacilli bacterium]